MTRGILVFALLALAASAKHILGYAARKRALRDRREALQTWEAEGGAVPVGRSQTTASQIPPATFAAQPGTPDFGLDPLRRSAPLAD
jgi:hypothetical protein